MKSSNSTSSAVNKLHVLLIGHMSSDVSGSSLSFKQLVDALSNDDRVVIHVINTARPAHLTSSRIVNLITALKVTSAALLRLRNMDIVTFHASRPAMMLYGPILYVLARVFRKPVVLRLFGGALELEYEALSPVGRYIFDKTILKADLILLQTKHLVSYFEQRGGGSIRWFSNSRPLNELRLEQEIGQSVCRRFIFLGRVVKEKGVEVILESIPLLKPGISIDIYGSFDGSYTAEKINTMGAGVVNYKGVLSFEKVFDMLPHYDALILPTFYRGEGYPGVILEAYSQGLPVIATKWRSIPEIVDENTGILIPVGDTKALAQAMNDLHSDTELYQRLKRGAQIKSLEFSDRVWFKRFVEWCDELARVEQ